MFRIFCKDMPLVLRLGVLWIHTQSIKPSKEPTPQSKLEKWTISSDLYRTALQQSFIVGAFGQIKLETN